MRGRYGQIKASYYLCIVGYEVPATLSLLFFSIFLIWARVLQKVDSCKGIMNTYVSL